MGLRYHTFSTHPLYPCKLFPRAQQFFLYQLYHQQWIHVANNWFHWVCWRGVFDVFEWLDLLHFWGDAVWEFLHLLPDVFQEGCTQPPAGEYDWKIGMPARYIDIAAPLLIECVSISDHRIPRFVLPIASTPSWMRVEIMSEVILMILFPFLASETGVFLFVSLYERILCTIEVQSLTGYRILSNLLHWVTISHFLSFFCHLKVTKTQSAKCNSVESFWRVMPCWIKAIFCRHSCFVCRCLAFVTL